MGCAALGHPKYQHVRELTGLEVLLLGEPFLGRGVYETVPSPLFCSCWTTVSQCLTHPSPNT
jgi:hypothetical protein